MPLNKTKQKGTKTKKGTNQSETKNIERGKAQVTKKTTNPRKKPNLPRLPLPCDWNRIFKMADTETHDDFSSTSLNDPDDVDNRFVS